MATQAEELRTLLAKNPLFSLLEEDVLNSLLPKFEFLHHELGQPVIQKGEPGDSFYVILGGRARVVATSSDGSELTLATLSRGEFFGERALLKDEERSATVRAASDLVVGRLMKTDFVEVIETFPEAKEFLEEYVAHEAMHNFLREFTVLSALTAKEVKAWVENMTQERFGAGEFIFHQGDEPDKFYVIMEGKVDILKEEDGEEELITSLREGDFFGELALLTHKKRFAGARAKEDVLLLSLTRENFESLVLKSDKLKDKISNVVALYNLDLVPEDLPFEVRKGVSAERPREMTRPAPAPVAKKADLEGFQLKRERLEARQ